MEYTATVECSNGLHYEETYTVETAESVLQNLKNFLLQENSELYTYTWETQLPQNLPAENCQFTALATKVRYRLTVITDPWNAETTTWERTLDWGDEIVLEAPQLLRGRKFLGWLTAGEETVPSLMPTKNLTIYGGWEWLIYTMNVVDLEKTTHEISYTVKEADDSLYVQALFASFLLPENTKAYTYDWDVPLPETLPLESGKTYVMTKTAVEYTITFANVTEVEPIIFTIETISNVVFPEEPGRIGYTVEWDKEPSELTLENVKITAVYTPIEYTISFAGVEDMPPITFTVENMSGVRMPAVPQKRGYHGKWDKKLSEIGLENVTVTAIYTPIEYTITFINAEVESLTFTVETLPNLVFPEVPLKVGYMGKWDKTKSQIDLENTTVSAVYTPIEYMITFENADDIPAIKFTIETLETLVFPEVPDRIGYTSKWDKLPLEISLENATVTAVYTPITYTLTFANAEGVEDVTFTVETMLDLQLPTVPQKVGYTGKWDKSLSDLGLANTTVTAIYTPIEYTLCFVAVEEVSPIVFTIENIDAIQLPAVPEKVNYTGKWDKDKTDITLEDITFTAIYTPIEYTLHFVGTEEVSPIVFTVENIGILQLPAVPQKTGYTGKWDKNLSNIGLKNMTVTAIYTPIEYTIVFAGVEDVTSVVFTIETLTSIQLPAVPEKAGYVGSWDKSLSDIGLNNVTLTAVYTIIEYSVTFAGVEGIEPIIFTVETLPMLTLPDVPAKEGFTAAWNKTVAEVKLENTVVTAVYTPLPVGDQVKDYGEKVVNSCSGSVALSSIFTPIGVALIVCFKKKED